MEQSSEAQDLSNNVIEIGSTSYWIPPSPALPVEPAVFTAAIAVVRARRVAEPARRRRRHTAARSPEAAKVAVHSRTASFLHVLPAFSSKYHLVRQTAKRSVSHHGQSWICPSVASNDSSARTEGSSHNSTIVYTRTQVPMEQFIPSTDSHHIAGALALTRVV